MNPFKFVRNLFRRGEDPGRGSYGGLFSFPIIVNGRRLTANEALQLSAVWACASILARSIGQIEWNIYEPIRGTKKRRSLNDDPRYDMLNLRPNPETTAVSWRETMMLLGVLFGNSYSEIVTDRAQRPAQLWGIADGEMTLLRKSDWSLVYQYRSPSGELVELKPEQVFHLKGLGLSSLMGNNIILQAAQSLAVAYAQEQYANNFFNRGAQLGGVLEYPGRLGPDRHDQLRKEWAENQGGAKNSFKPLILEGGMKFTATSADAEEAAIVEQRQFSVEDICRWFGVPPHKVQHLLRASFSNIEHSSIEFVTDGVNPWCRRFEQEADWKLFRASRARTLLDVRPLKAGDNLSRANAASSWRNSGVKTANEIREEEGLDAVGPEGDVLFVQGALAPMKSLIAKNEIEVEKLEKELNPPPPPVDDLEKEDPEEAEIVPDEEADAINVVTVAIRQSCSRAAKRIEKNKSLSFFKAQTEIVRDEINVWSPWLMKAAGRKLTSEDAEKLINAYMKAPEGELFPTLEITK